MRLFEQLNKLKQKEFAKALETASRKIPAHPNNPSRKAIDAGITEELWQFEKAYGREWRPFLTSAKARTIFVNGYARAASRDSFVRETYLEAARQVGLETDFEG